MLRIDNSWVLNEVWGPREAWGPKLWVLGIVFSGPMNWRCLWSITTLWECHTTKYTAPHNMHVFIAQFSTGCPPLTLENGNISYSDDFLIGSVATFTCDTAGGFMLNNPCVNTLECTAERGWVGPELTCQRKPLHHYMYHTKYKFYDTSRIKVQT